MKHDTHLDVLHVEIPMLAHHCCIARLVSTASLIVHYTDSLYLLFTGTSVGFDVRYVKQRNHASDGFAEIF